MAEKPAEGLTVKFQGKLCAPSFQITRSAGLEPDFGFVLMPSGEFKAFEIRDPKPLTGTQDKSAAPVGPGFEASGDLVIQERVVERNDAGQATRDETHEVTFAGLLLPERAVEAAFPDDDSSELCKIELTDVRELWASRGVVFGWINVPRQGGAQKRTGTGTQERAGTGTQERAGTGAVAADFLPGSLDGDVPWTLKRVLEAKILPALPGRPRLKEISAPVASFTPVGHVWTGARAKAALAAVLEEARATLALNLDGSVSVWAENEGDLQDATGQKITFAGASIDPRVQSARKIAASYQVPRSVVVLGAPSIQTERLRLEPVGELAGRIVPLDDALRGIGLEPAIARRLAVLPHERRASSATLSAWGLREFERWAYKWFRVPGGAEGASDKLPILDARGSAGSAGELLPLRAWSQTFTVVSILGATLAKLEANLLLGSANKVQRSVCNQTLTALEALGGKAFRQVSNLPFAEAASGDTASGNGVGFEVDRARGVVKFASVQGHVATEGVTLEEAELAINGARVELEFAYQRKAPATGAPGPTDRYVSVWTREGSGADAKLSLSRVPGAGDPPHVIERPDLQLVEGAAGTNLEALDRLAREATKAVLTKPFSAEGAVVTFARFVPLVTTGRVRGVTWETNGQLPRVTAHVGLAAPLAPLPKLDTRGGLSGGALLAASEVVSKGLGP